MASYPKELAQDAAFQSHTSRLTELWSLPRPAQGLNTNNNNSHKKKVFKYKEINQPNSVQPKITGSKLRSDVYWQGALKRKRRETNGVKGVGVFLCQTWHNQTAEKYQHNFNSAEK